MPGMDLGGRKPRREAPATVQWPNPGLRTVGGVVRPGVQQRRQSHAPSGAPSSRSGVARLTAPCAVESARLSVCGYDSLIRRLGTIGGITLAVTGAAVGYALGLLFVLLLIGGSVYSTECLRPEGVHTHGWQLGETVPYLTHADPYCENHSLTRYVLGKVGAMSDVDK
jgi:hypothetical protein